MRWFTLTLLILASLAFVASSVSFAFAPNATFVQVAPLLHLDLSGHPYRVPSMARPVGTTLRLLLAAVWMAVLIHAVRAVLAERRLAAQSRVGRPPHTTVAHPAFILALLSGALWPLLAQLSSRVPGLVVAAVMMVAAIWAAMERRQRLSAQLVLTGTVEIFAGWATVALYAAFAAMLINNLGVSMALAAVVSVLLLMLTAVEVQLRLGNAVAYGFTVIWALIGICANAMQTELTVATAAIVAIAAMVAALVRVMS